MTWISGVARRSVLPLTFAAGIAVIAWFPSKESIGCAADRLVAWWSPRPKQTDQATLRVMKPRYVGPGAWAGRPSSEVAAPISVSSAPTSVSSL